MQVDDPSWLGEQAARCRRLAAATSDSRVAETLKQMAADYDAQAAALAANAAITVEQMPDESDAREDEPRPPLAD